jgi:transcriptional regulator with XRE-family HTH domain
MAQTTVNERIKILIDSMGISVRAFSELVGESNSNINNYIGERQSMPPVAFLEKLINHIENINPKWLITGKDEPFTGDAPTLSTKAKVAGKKNNVAVTGGHGKTIQNNYNLADCEKERDTLRIQLDNAQREIELLNGQLQMQKTIIEGKDQMLDLLKGGFNRPN